MILGANLWFNSCKSAEKYHKIQTGGFVWLFPFRWTTVGNRRRRCQRLSVHSRKQISTATVQRTSEVLLIWLEALLTCIIYSFVDFSAVHSCKFLSDKMRVASFSDDRTVRCWDVTTEEEIRRFDGHSVSSSCDIRTMNDKIHCILSFRIMWDQDVSVTPILISSCQVIFSL